MEDYPSLAEGNGLENRQVGQTTQEFESLILLFIIAGWSSNMGSNPVRVITIYNYRGMEQSGSSSGS